MKVYKKRVVTQINEILEGIRCDICGRFEKYESDFIKTSKEIEFKEHELPGVPYEIITEKVDGTIMIAIHDNFNDVEFISLDICGDCAINFVLKFIRKYKKENIYIDDETK